MREKGLFGVKIVTTTEDTETPSAAKSRYGGDSSSAPYFMGAHRHDFDACA